MRKFPMVTTAMSSMEVLGGVHALLYLLYLTYPFEKREFQLSLAPYRETGIGGPSRGSVIGIEDRHRGSGMRV